MHLDETDLHQWLEMNKWELWGIVWAISASLVAQMLKHLPAMRETHVQSLGQEDALEKEMAIHSSTLA